MDKEVPYEKIRVQIQKAVGKKVLYFSEILTIVGKLGLSMSKNSLRINMRSFAISPRDYDIELMGAAHDLKAYGYADVWSYLQELEKKGAIDLRQKNINSLESLLEQGFHKIKLMTG